MRNVRHIRALLEHASQAPAQVTLRGLINLRMDEEETAAMLLALQDLQIVNAGARDHVKMVVGRTTRPMGYMDVLSVAAKLAPDVRVIQLSFLRGLQGPAGASSSSAVLRAAPAGVTLSVTGYIDGGRVEPEMAAAIVAGRLVFMID